MDAYIDVGIDNWMLNRWIAVLLQGGRGHWDVYFTSPQSFFNNVFLFVSSTTLGTFIEF